MKAKFAVLVIVLGMSAPMFANGVPVVYTASGTLSLQPSGPDSLGLNNKAFALSLTIDNTSTSTLGATFTAYTSPFISAALTITPTGPAASITKLVIGENPPGEDILEFQLIIGGRFARIFYFFPSTEWTGQELTSPLGASNPVFANLMVEEDSGLSVYTITGGEIQVNAVPEPGTLSLLAAGLLMGAAFRKRFK